MPKDDKSKEKDSEISDKERIDKGHIMVRIIIEVLGAPKDYVEEAIKLVIDKSNDIDGAEVVSESTYEAEEKGKLFCAFSELEIWFDNLDKLTQFIFDFTPSSIEIMQPTTIALKGSFISGFMNDFLLKMHDLGLKLKDTAAKEQLLQKNADTLVRNFMKFSLSEPRNAEQLVSITGIPKDNVIAMLENFEKAGIAKKEGDIYSLVKK